MSSPEKKNPSPLSLPHELLVSCIARVRRLHYPTLSLVSKRFRSLLTSPELHKVRSSLGITEPSLYICLDDFTHGFRWFTLSRKPKTLTDETKKSSGYVFATVPVTNSPPALPSSLVAFGSSVYNIAAIRYSEPSSKVFVLDCWSHTWREGSSLEKKLRPLCGSVVGEKIYLAGSYGDGLRNSVHVMDTKSELWDSVAIPLSDEMEGYLCLGSACVDGKFYVNTERETAGYDAEEGRWELVEGKMGDFMRKDSYCVIEDVLYSVHEGVFRWYDSEGRMWRDLEGVGLPEFPPSACVKLVNYGGKMAVLWDEHRTCSDGFMTVIWCGEIAVERRGRCEIWGKAEWVDEVLTVPKVCEFVKVLAVTV